MSTRALLKDLRRRDVFLEAHGGRLIVDAPAGAITDELQASLAKHKQALIDLLEWERRELEEGHGLGCVARWARYPTWIVLHDSITGEWHEVRASECLPGVVAEADKRREQGGAA